MFSLTIRQTGMDDVRTLMSRMLQSVNDLTPAWPAVEVEFRAIEREQFESEGGAGQIAWPSLSNRYKAWKEVHFPGKKILERTGALKGSLTGRGSGSFVEATPRKLTIGSSIPYGRFHQQGEGVPQRPPIALKNSKAARLQAVLHRYFNGTAQGRQQGRGQIPAGI